MDPNGPKSQKFDCVMAASVPFVIVRSCRPLQRGFAGVGCEFAMGAVQVGGHEVPQDAPQIWSHVVTGYEDTPCTADEGLVSLPPCKILTVDPVVSKELSLPKAQPVPEVLEAQMPEVQKESEVSQSETQVVQQLNGRRKSDLVGNLEVLRRESLSETSRVFDAKTESLLPDKGILHRTLFFA